MATINHSSGADIIVPSNNATTYRGLGGDDTYILSNSIAANAAITIVDTSGANKIQFTALRGNYLGHLLRELY